MTTSASNVAGNMTGNNATVINKINSGKSTVANTTTNSNTAAASQTQLTGNLNTFLNMLTTQLKNQDPMSPMDSTQFTNQLVQFSAVEQQINTNSNLETLIGLQKTTQQSQAIGYLGQTVTVPGGTLPLQNSQSAFSYTLPSAASTGTITINNSAGTTVAQVPISDLTAGTHSLSWNGKESGGGTAPDGQYTISVTASDSAGKALTVSTSTYGVVTGVTSDPTNGTELQLGPNVTTPLSSVTGITLQPKPAIRPVRPRQAPPANRPAQASGGYHELVRRIVLRRVGSGGGIIRDGRDLRQHLERQYHRLQGHLGQFLDPGDPPGVADPVFAGRRAVQAARQHRHPGPAAVHQFVHRRGDLGLGLFIVNSSSTSSNTNTADSPIPAPARSRSTRTAI